uniref:F-box domain-containing protein n=1 Tax=Tanacetum cinerariifolium TaxID=118510 RepID=A0A699HD94_TANCI|nr:hypothetical protein [Tanacetum cinerariifolium]
MAFPRLQELAATQNSNSLTDAMPVYIKRKISEDLHFAAELSHLWEVLYGRVNEQSLLIAELNVGDKEVECGSPSLLAPLRKLIMLRSCSLAMVCFCVVVRDCLFIITYINPSTNQYKKLPYPDLSLDNSPYYTSAGLRIAFDPTKSPHYKLVDDGRIFCDNDIQIYSLETGKWSLCNDHFNYSSFDHIDSAIYWNDGLHWLETKNRQLMHYNLNINDHDHPIITTIPIPQRGMTFLKSYGYMDPMKILIQMSHLLHLQEKLFEWRGSLFLVCLDDFGSREFTIYEMMIGEQDSFFVIKLSGKVVQFNLISKTLHEIYDCESNQVDDNHDDNDDADDDDELLQQFQSEHNIYEFIPSFACV